MVVVLAQQFPILRDARLGFNNIAFLVGGFARHHAVVQYVPVLLDKTVIGFVQLGKTCLPACFVQLRQPCLLHQVTQPDIAFHPGFFFCAQFHAVGDRDTNTFRNAHQGAILGYVDNTLALHAWVKVNPRILGCPAANLLLGVGVRW